MTIMGKRFWGIIMAAVIVLAMLPVIVVNAETGFNSELIVNGNAETGSITGWNDDTGMGRWSSGGVFGSWALPAEGSNFFFLYNVGMDYLEGTMSQWIELSGTEGSGLFSMISAGDVSFGFTVSMYQGISKDNEVKAIIEEYAADGTTLLKTSQVVNTTSSGGEMGDYLLNIQLDPNTRKFKVILSAALTNGSHAQFDKISLKLTDASGGSAPEFGEVFPTLAETDAGETYTTDFTIRDADDGDLDNLTFSASSTNAYLVPASNVTVSGTGETRTLSITPTSGLSGETDITLVVSDGKKSAQKTFHFIVHKVIFMDTNLVENGSGKDGLASWTPSTPNMFTNSGGFYTSDPNASMSQNIDISKYYQLIDEGVTDYKLSACFSCGYGAVDAQFYKDIACTIPVGSPMSISSSYGGTETSSAKIPANAKGVKITFRNTNKDYSIDVQVTDISFIIVNNFPKISPVSNQKTDLSPVTIPVDVYTVTGYAVLKASSSDQSVVPDDSISVEGSGFHRSITFTPLKNGSFTITLILFDGFESVSASFNVTAHEPARIVSVSTVPGFYTAGNNLDFTLHFNYPVTGGTGSVLPLEIGGVPVTASYYSSTDTSIVYRYTVDSSHSGDVTIGSAINDETSPITGAGEYAVEKDINDSTTGITVLQAPVLTSTASDGFSDYGTKITFTATLNCAEPLPGQIQFKANGENLGNPVDVSGNTASYETAETEFSAGLFLISAVYIPDGDNFQFGNLVSDSFVLNIYPKYIKITPQSASKIYGTPDPALTYQITEGELAGSDSLAGSLSREEGEEIGEYEITQGTVTNENNPNYNISFVTGIKFTILPINATMNPAVCEFDQKIIKQADVQTTIEWGSATAVTDIKAVETSIGAEYYIVSGNVLTIKKEYLALQSTGSLELTVVFDIGEPAVLTVNIIDSRLTDIPVTDITVVGMDGASSVFVGETLQMQAVISPENATDKDVEWSIESGDGATIDQTGLLTAIDAGTVTVRATAKDGYGAYGELEVNIVEDIGTVEISFAQSPYKSIIKTDTCELFFNDTVDVTITSTGGRPDHYEYQIVSADDTFDADSAWTNGASFSIHPDFKGRVYARAVYKSGATTAITFISIVTDKSKPDITAYYDDASTSIEAIVTDDCAGIEKITWQIGSDASQTINLEPSETQDITMRKDFTIDDLPYGQYDVVINATDNSGNAALLGKTAARHT